MDEFDTGQNDRMSVLDNTPLPPVSAVSTPLPPVSTVTYYSLHHSRPIQPSTQNIMNSSWRQNTRTLSNQELLDSATSDLNEIKNDRENPARICSVASLPVSSSANFTFLSLVEGPHGSPTTIETETAEDGRVKGQQLFPDIACMTESLDPYRPPASPLGTYRIYSSTADQLGSEPEYVYDMVAAAPNSTNGNNLITTTSVIAGHLVSESTNENAGDDLHQYLVHLHQPGNHSHLQDMYTSSTSPLPSISLSPMGASSSVITTSLASNYV